MLQTSRQSKGGKKLFPGQREGEIALLVIPQHWWRLSPPLTRGGLILLFSISVLFVKKTAFYVLGNGIFASLYFLWIILWAGYILYYYLTWQNSLTIVSNERIINIHQKGLFNRRVREVELEKITDILHEQRGFWASTLNFGTIYIESLSEPLELTYVAKPAETQAQLFAIVKEATQEPPVTVEELVDFIKEHRI